MYLLNYFLKRFVLLLIMFIVYICEWVCTSVSAGALAVQKRVLDLLAGGTNGFESPDIGAGTESGRATQALKY